MHNRSEIIISSCSPDSMVPAKNDLHEYSCFICITTSYILEKYIVHQKQFLMSMHVVTVIYTYMHP
jgi:hypothetical protein